VYSLSDTRVPRQDAPLAIRRAVPPPRWTQARAPAGASALLRDHSPAMTQPNRLGHEAHLVAHLARLGDASSAASDPTRKPSTTLRKRGSKGGGGEIRPPTHPAAPRRRHEKGPDLQGRFRWRDPDSNRGHHDFQSGGRGSRTMPECLENTGFLPLRSVGCKSAVCGLLPVLREMNGISCPSGRDTARAGPRWGVTGPAVGNTQAVSLISAPRKTPGSAWDRAPVPTPEETPACRPERH
jgi:hypothetical protein